MGDNAKVEPGALEWAIETLVDCAELPSVAKGVGTEALMAVAAELNACLPAGRRVNLTRRAAEPWRWLGGSHLERFRERLVLEIGVRTMGSAPPDDARSRDRPIEQLIFEDLALAEAESRRVPPHAPRKGVESWLRLPSPSVTYNLDAWLGEPSSKAPYRTLSDELKLATVAAARECTDDGDWIYAVDEPEGADRCFRFWPHRTHEGMSWEVSPISHVDDQLFVSRDFTWGMYTMWGFDESVDSALSVFGRSFIDAFQRLQPQALLRVIRTDGKPA